MTFARTKIHALRQAMICTLLAFTLLVTSIGFISVPVAYANTGQQTTTRSDRRVDRERTTRGTPRERSHDQQSSSSNSSSDSRRPRAVRR